ncbi:3-ketosteroid reductase-like protein [Lojkania enalia]|uniref:3-ketosteroid reductase-like protein n=1 Tax=Lojkania enalia TaxID=147567 RepID=A0A9P4KEF5_9PLEO|nr:3-ketosteroid reductase-like protein [Didymosphaeria enalia]
MPIPEDIPQPDDGFYVLVTGANSGLGLAVGCRLIDEFLQTRPQSQSLVLIITTRDLRKGDATVRKLREHLSKICREQERKVPGIRMLLEQRVHFRQEILDLTSLVSVQKLSKRLRDTTPKLHSVICNAGIGGWEDLYWGRAVWTILTNWKSAVTWPTFKKSGVGWVTKPQIPITDDGKKIEEPPLGEVFCANFFGHYLLGHYLAPLLARHPPEENTRGRLIWVSSLEAYAHSLNISDIQSIPSHSPYEASKRLTDIMGITSTLPSTMPLVDEYLDYHGPSKQKTKPRIYVSQPGICGTSIFALPLILEYAMFAAFFVARWLGSQWHPVTAYKGAVSMVWLALAKQSTLDAMEAQEGVGKWGSACDRRGDERVERTEVEGWGWGGFLNERKRKTGRSPYARDLTPELKRRFEEAGEACWRELERLRVEWETRLEDAGVGTRME